MTASSTSIFTFESHYWEDDNVLNPTSPNPSANIDAKFAGFSARPAAQIRGCGQGLYDSSHCRSYSLPSSYSNTALTHIFASVPKSSAQSLVLGQNVNGLWESMYGLTTVWPDACFKTVAINLVDDLSGQQCRVRFGAVINNECNVWTANFAIGFGGRSYSGVSSGSGQAGTADGSGPAINVLGSIWVLASV